jgi:hypothetical protein
MPKDDIDVLTCVKQCASRGLDRGEALALARAPESGVGLHDRSIPWSSGINVDKCVKLVQSHD